nr:peptidyl-prolyl cis-trans isomerase FKBP42 [Ipomoea batatas]
MLQATVASTARRRHQATAPSSSPLLHVLKLLIPPHADTTSLHCLLSCSPSTRFQLPQVSFGIKLCYCVEFLDQLLTDQNAVDEIITEGTSVVHGELPQDDGPPKVDSAMEVLHEKVTKQIIKEGHGQKPSKYATCFCKFKMRHSVGI